VSTPDPSPEPELDALRSRIRREPPQFRRVRVRAVDVLTPRMLRITFAGPELDGLTVDEPAASVRLLLPAPGTRELVMPTWNGNEFLLADGSRPIIRTFTPYRLDAEASELELWAVLHGDGPASDWATAAEPGAEAAISGPGRGYPIDPDASAFLVAGDETAIPAISQLLVELPAAASVQVHIEVADPDARLALPEHPRAEITWSDLPGSERPGDALVRAVAGADIEPATIVWVAGEAAAVQRIRRYLFDDLGLPRSQTTVRGYWKHGRGGDPDR
jgi:NADPH-dependent ferric siderophore reductase